MMPDFTRTLQLLRRALRLPFAVLAVLAYSGAAGAASGPAQSVIPEATGLQTVYGPKEYRREGGKPVTVIDHFVVARAITACQMIIDNGET